MNVVLITCLLQVFVSEAGWNNPRSHAAMGHVLLRNADKNERSICDSADRIVWAYSNAQADHPWVRYLNASCERPDYYRGVWDTQRCVMLVKRAESFLKGRVGDPCQGRADGWRSPKSRALRYALRHGYRRVKCIGGTTLAFVEEVEHERR